MALPQQSTRWIRADAYRVAGVSIECRIAAACALTTSDLAPPSLVAADEPASRQKLEGASHLELVKLGYLVGCSWSELGIAICECPVFGRTLFTNCSQRRPPIDLLRSPTRTTRLSPAEH